MSQSAEVKLFNMYKPLLHLCGAILLFSISGCSTLGYYWQAINGHAEILNRQKPVAEVLRDSETSTEVKQRLQLALEARQFAIDILKLPDSDSYRQYADIGRSYAVWNVIATERYSVKARQWCFLFVGCISYRGYFAEADAERYANTLQEQGDDVMVAGARAYSTLGWLDDPLLNSMLYKDDVRLVGIIFHELAHQRIYLKDFSSFNEAFATAVEIEGVLAWLRHHNDESGIKQYQASRQQQQAFNALLRKTRTRLDEVYEKEKDEVQKGFAKQQIFADLKAEYAAMKQALQWDNRYDDWMAQELNNAHLALVGTYYDYVPYFRATLKQVDGDFSLFYQKVDKLIELTPEQIKEKISAQ